MNTARESGFKLARSKATGSIGSREKRPAAIDAYYEFVNPHEVH